MSQSIKVCPICQAHNPESAAFCANCGARIGQVAPAVSAAAPVDGYDFRRGETDLLEASLHRRGQFMGACLFIAFAVILGAAGTGLLFSRMTDETGDELSMTIEAPTRMAGPTVTPAPPTPSYTPSRSPTPVPSDTPTPAPCLRQVSTGDSLIGIILTCGHQTLEIMPTVMALNGIDDEAFIRAGQVIRVPPPTPTIDPNATDPPTAAPGNDSAAADSQLTLLAFDPFAPTLTPTLLPGLMWHSVQSGDSMISIALRYETNAKGLSDLNPEIPFLLCDFGETFGGPECTVQLSVNQLLRVPAPTPAPTLVPTSSGSETPTPTPTATFNAPLLQAPPELKYFGADDQVTLRWVGTGMLHDRDSYRLTITADDKGKTHNANTRELFFILPADWQARDGERHIYTWQVSVVDAESGVASYASGERSFVWQGAEADS